MSGMGTFEHPISLDDEDREACGEAVAVGVSDNSDENTAALPTACLPRKRTKTTPCRSSPPVKLFMTKQMEATENLDPIIHENTTSLHRLIVRSDQAIQWIVIATFLVDFDLLLAELPELVSVNLVILIYGDAQCNDPSRLQRACTSADGTSHLHLHCLKPSDPPNSRNNPLSRKIPYGVHHSKFFLVGYSDGILRVVIHTANLLYSDLHQKADAAYMQDFPKKDTKSSSTEFEDDLVRYIDSYRYQQRYDWESGERLTLSEQLRRYDYSTARAVLIPSTPGYHKGDDIHRVGHMKLCKTVRSSSTCRPGALVCQFSSMGSLQEGWLWDEFGASAVASKCEFAPIKLVFPTAEEVRKSVEGYRGGGSLPSNTRNVQKPFLGKLYHKWSSETDTQNPFALARNLPHIKTFYRYDESGDAMQWFVLSSHNISSAAWGQLQKSGSQFFVRHWELGVFLSPKTLGCKRLVPYTFAVSDNPSPGEMTVPLPYKFHPDEYCDGDEPWAWDKSYTLCDSYGYHGLHR